MTSMRFGWSIAMVALACSTSPPFAVGVVGLQGDANDDGMVDGHDVVGVIQLGFPTTFDGTDFDAWEANYGAAAAFAAFANGGAPGQPPLPGPGGSLSTDDVHLSLNLFPTTPHSATSGGNWTLVATVGSGSQAVAGFVVDMHHVDNGKSPDEIAVAANIGAINPVGANGPPYLDLGGGVTEFTFVQDLSDPGSVVPGVGILSFSSDADPFGNPAWDNATTIATGTYGTTLPSLEDAIANLLGGSDPNFTASAASVSTTVRSAAIPEPSAFLFGAVVVTAIAGAKTARLRNRRASVSR